MTYCLTKLSYPGWELYSDSVDEIYKELDTCVCDRCRLTKDEFLNTYSHDELDASDWVDIINNINPHTFVYFFPDDYEYLDVMDKIDCLLNTACGCEYYFNGGPNEESQIELFREDDKI